MTRNHLITTAAAALALAAAAAPGAAQTHEHGDHQHLHVSSRWSECSIQLAPTLTQGAWRQFTREAGLVAYFRPLVDARPLGKGRFDVSLVQWETAIDDSDAAWNDTFVHPDSTHWLFEGSGLKFPGVTVRAGVSATTDVGVYFTKNPNANYGFVGAQVQRSLAGSGGGRWKAAVRGSFVTLYGPEDVDLTVYGADLVASRTIRLRRWAELSPYAGVSGYLGTAHEKSNLVQLHDERAGGGQAMAGAVLRVHRARVALEYNAARVRSISMRVGIGSGS